MWWIYALLSAFFASLTALLAKAGVKNIDSDLATAIRTVVILAVAWGVVFFKSNTVNIASLSKNNLLFLGLSGIATGLSWLFYFKALKLGNVSMVAPVEKLSVALTVILSVIFLHEALTVKAILGVLMIVGGIVLLISQ